MHNTPMLRSLALAGLVAAAGTAHAALTVYTTQAAFLAAVAAPGIDSFAGLSVTSETTSPMLRSAGAYSYTVTSTSSFYGAGTPANPWLSTNAATDMITFSGFSGAASAIGGLFFGSNVSGAYQLGTVQLTATDSLGATSTQTIGNATQTSFLGFRSTGSMTALVVSAVSPNASVWPAVDNLMLSVTAVPEPHSAALMLAGLAGLAGLGWMRVRQRR